MNVQTPFPNVKLLLAGLFILLLGAASCIGPTNCPAYSRQPSAKSLDRRVWGSDEAPAVVRNKTAHYRTKGQRNGLADLFTRR